MIRKFLLLVLAMPLAACVSVPKYVAMDAKTVNGLKDIKVLSAVPQDEIVIVAEDPGVSKATGGGLLVALIDSQISKSRQEEIQKQVEPFYAAVDDVDFRKALWTELLPQVQGIFKGKISEINARPYVLSRDEQEKLLAEMRPGQAFMYIGTAYSFTQDFSRLNVMTGIDLWIGGQREPIYSNMFNYQSAAVSASRGSPVGEWAADTGRRYRTVIAESITETAKMLSLDLKHPRINGVEEGLTSASTQKFPYWSAVANQTTLTGPVLDSQQSRVVLRHTDGRLYSVPR